MEEEDFEVLDLGVGEEDDVLAEGGAGLGSGDIDLEGGVINGLVLEGDLLEATALEGLLGVSGRNLSSEDWKEHTNTGDGTIWESSLASGRGWSAI